MTFVTNATNGFNAVIRSLNFGPEDTLLTLNLGYGIREISHHLLTIL